MEKRAKRDKDKESEFYLDICLKGSNNIRDILGIDDDSHSLLHHRAVRASRNYYIYEALNEIEKAGTALMRAQEFLSGPEPEIKDRVAKNILTAAQEELMLWVRKLVELLAELILFQSINDDAYYRHYMLVKEIKSLKDAIKNGEDAYGCHIQNYQKQVDDLQQEISKLESSGIEFEKCWYLAIGKKGRRTSGIKGKLSSLEERINAAFAMASPDQVIALGTSYDEGYGSFSDAMHFNAIRDTAQRISMESVKAKVAGIGIISANIIIQARKLLKDRRRKGYAAFIAKIFTHGSEAGKMLHDRKKPGIKVGDFVNAQGELAEVTRVMKGSYGFRSFRVKFLLKEDTEVAGSGERKTIWTHHNPEFEEYPAIWVRKLYGRKDIIESLRQEIIKHDPGADVRTQNLTPFIRDSIIHIWKNVGLKEHVKGRPADAQEKIEQEIKRIQSNKKNRDETK